MRGAPQAAEPPRHPNAPGALIAVGKGSISGTGRGPAGLQEPARRARAQPVGRLTWRRVADNSATTDELADPRSTRRPGLVHLLRLEAGPRGWYYGGVSRAGLGHRSSPPTASVSRRSSGNFMRGAVMTGTWCCSMNTPRPFRACWYAPFVTSCRAGSARGDRLGTGR